MARDLFDLTEESEIGHIRLADEADLLVVAPATADAIARLAAGMANDLLAAVVLATRAPDAAGPGDEREHVGEPAHAGQPGTAPGAAGAGAGGDGRA